MLSGALAELTWPNILIKRHIFRYYHPCQLFLYGVISNVFSQFAYLCREVFRDFDPALVSKMNEKKIVAPGSIAASLLSVPKLRTIIENARQIVKVISLPFFLLTTLPLGYNQLKPSKRMLQVHMEFFL